MAVMLHAGLVVEHQQETQIREDIVPGLNEGFAIRALRYATMAIPMPIQSNNSVSKRGTKLDEASFQRNKPMHPKPSNEDQRNPPMQYVSASSIAPYVFAGLKYTALCIHFSDLQ